MRQAFVRPKAGMRVPYPDRPHEQLPPDGAMVNLDDYWRNRIRDGDVTESAKPPKAAKKPAAPKDA